MMRTSINRASIVVGFLFASSWMHSAAAQNYDGNHQVRFGTFLQGAAANGNATITTLGPVVGAPPTNVDTVGLDIGSAGIGVSGGLEWVRKGQWSWGFEIDGAALSGNQTKLFENRFGLDYLATARVRAGMYVMPDTLWYGTIGLGFLGTEARLLTGATKKANTQTGLAIGTGLEWDFGGGILFGEYLYTAFGDIDTSFANTLGGDTTYKYDFDMHNFRVGVKFKVGHDHYYDDVARRIGK